jgi:ABC-type transporter Mla subunit MlaD
MDPISAFQLAAAVIGVVDFSTRVLSETREIYKSASGHTARDVELSTLAQELSGLGAQLQNRIPDGATPLVGAEATLVDLSQQCVDASDRLNKAICDLRSNTSEMGKISTAAGSFASALKSVWKGSEIESLRERLSEIRSQMTLAILVCVL